MTIGQYRLILWIIFVGGIGTYLHSLSLSSSIVNFVVETYTLLLLLLLLHHTYQCVQSCFPQTRKTSAKRLVAGPAINKLPTAASIVKHPARDSGKRATKRRCNSFRSREQEKGPTPDPNFFLGTSYLPPLQPTFRPSSYQLTYLPHAIDLLLHSPPSLDLQNQGEFQQL